MDIIKYLNQEKNIILNIQQIKAINNINDDTLVLAVPGSGKTTVLVSRLANIIINKNISKDNILTLTFSKESTRNMKQRFEYFFSNIIKSPPHFSTIHSFCYGVLKEYSIIYNKKMPQNIDYLIFEKRNKLQKINKSINNTILSEEEIENLISDISYAKNMLLSKEEIKNFKSEINNFYRIFEEYNISNIKDKLIDFDDMLIHTITILKKHDNILKNYQNKYKYINIDEAQDSSKAQHKIIKLIKNNNIIFMVGDEDQSIYSFRGAYPKGILNFKNDYPNGTILKMEENFRSNKDIVKYSNSFIKNNIIRYNKDMFTKNNNENSINIINIKDFNMQYKEILNFIENKNDYDTTAIIFKNNESSLPLVDIFLNQGIKYKTNQNNNSFFNSFVVKDIISFLTLSYDEYNISCFKQLQFKMYLKNNIMDIALKNYKSNDNLFDICLNLKGLESYIINRIKLYKSYIPKLKSMASINAINFIENKLKYTDFINNKIKKGYNAENIYNKLSILKAIANQYDSVHSFLTRLNQLKENDNINKTNQENTNLFLTTIHSSKGLEFDNVILIDLIDGQFPSQKAIQEKVFGNINLIEEETRLFYVAVTRAKSKIIIYKSNKLNHKEVRHSRFIDYFIKQEQKIYKLKNTENFSLENIKSNKIKHKFFGEGLIKKIDKNELIVDFDLFGIKTISLDYCIKNNIISLK